MVARGSTVQNNKTLLKFRLVGAVQWAVYNASIRGNEYMTSNTDQYSVRRSI